MFLNQLGEDIPIDWFHQVAGGTQMQPRDFVVYDCDHDDGYVGQIRIRFEASQNCPAVHLGHHHVQSNNSWTKLLGELEASFALWGAYPMETWLGQVAGHQVTHCRIIVNYEDGVPL